MLSNKTGAGRPRIEVPSEFPSHYQAWKKGEMTAVYCMYLLGLSKSTFYRMVQSYEAEQREKQGEEIE